MKDDHQFLFNIKLMIEAEKLRPLDNDIRDTYYQASHIKNLQEIYDRFEQLSQADYSRRLGKDK